MGSATFGILFCHLCIHVVISAEFSPQSIPTAALPEEMTKMGSKTMVYVTEVIDPECFYFVLEDKGGIIGLAVKSLLNKTSLTHTW